MTLALATLAGACGNRRPEITPSTIDADRLLYERGLEAFKEESWLRAREYFAQIRDNYPQSSYRADARLGVADTYFEEGSAESYVQALSEYREFLSLYPTHPRAGYAQYKLGMVHFEQMRRPERDQTETRQALEEFGTFVERYPNHELEREVRAKLREARDRLSESSFKVGHFYYRINWYPGAIERFKAVLKEDPAYSKRDELYFYLADALARSGQAAEALPYFEQVIQEFPESRFVQRAQDRLGEVKATVKDQSP